MAVDDPDELYAVMYRAVTDALWHVVGTMTASLVLIIMFFIGLSVLLSAVTAVGSISLAGVVFGAALVGFSVISFMWMFDLLPWS
jgi:hypothetical protein